MEDFSKDIELVGSIDAVPTILDVVCRTTGMGFAAIARVTDDRWVACGVLDQIRFGLKPGSELEIKTTICNEIRQHMQPVIIDHVAEDESFRHHHTPLKYGFQSYISMPIVLPGGRFFGTLCAIDPKPALLNTPAIVGMFKMFAELIAFHIDAADKLSASENSLKAELENSLLRDQFIAVLSHDLRSPLGAITMGTALLKEGDLDPRQLSLIEMMEQSSGKMLGLIENVMDFARGRLGEGISLGEKTYWPLEPVLQNVIGAVAGEWPGREIDVIFDVSEPIHYDPKRFAQLFTNLLANAMSHGKRDMPVVVRATSSAGLFELSVSNAADPIPSHILERIFEPFSRGEAGNDKQGLGLGLYIASQIAMSHGGTLEAVSTDEETRFTFIMSTGAAQVGKSA